VIDLFFFLPGLRSTPARRAARKAVTAAPPSRPRVRDFQRSRVYRWEDEHVLVHDPRLLSLAEARALVETVFRWAEPRAARKPDWRPPIVGDGRGRRHAAGSRASIRLPRWARRRAIVLHECAHGLAHDRHGPAFVATYVDLLERFRGLERATLTASLDAARIVYASRR
jgi:hypothetical protein